MSTHARISPPFKRRTRSPSRSALLATSPLVSSPRVMQGFRSWLLRQLSLPLSFLRHLPKALLLTTSAPPSFIATWTSHHWCRYLQPLGPRFDHLVLSRQLALLLAFFQWPGCPTVAPILHIGLTLRDSMLEPLFLPLFELDCCLMGGTPPDPSDTTVNTIRSLPFGMGGPLSHR